MAIGLDSLRINWSGLPSAWNTLPRSLLPTCSTAGIIKDTSGNFIAQLFAKNPLGQGTFGRVDAFIRKTSTDESTVALKRPKHPNLDLFQEALFQWKLHNDLYRYGISFCVPKVIDIVRYEPSNDIWFTMEAFEPVLLSDWSVKHATAENIPLLLLQIALILEVFEQEFYMDHRDMKVNNILVVNESVNLKINWKTKKEITFPFRIVFIDFGFACTNLLDLRDGLPQLNSCPKEGRDIFQILVSLWRIRSLRTRLEPSWGKWIRSCIESANPAYLRLTEQSDNLNWMYDATDLKGFRAPLCAPWRIIQDCMEILEQ